MHGKRLLFVVLSALVLSGCVTSAEGERMSQRIDELAEQQRQTQERLEKEKAELTDMVASAKTDVAELQSVLKEARDLLARNNADLGAELTETRQELQRLQGLIEELEFKLTKVQQDLELFKEDVDIRFQSGEALANQLPDEAVPLMTFGKEKYDAAQWRSARKAFEKFVGKFPKHGQASEAQYLLGDTYFKDAQWVSAAFEFRRVLESYPNSQFADDATFHIGESFAKLGRCDQAKLFFETVVADYGSSKWASQARQRIADIKAGRCP